MAEDYLHGVEVVELDTGVRPISAARMSVIGLVGTAPDADPEAFPVNTPVLVFGRQEAAKLDTVGDGAGTLPDAMTGIFAQGGALTVIVRVDEGADDAATVSNVIGGQDADTGANQGIQALLDSQSVLGLVPRILAAPAHSAHLTRDDTTDEITGAPVADALLSVADRMRAVAVLDGPDTNFSDAVAWRDLFGSARAYGVDPWVSVWDTAADAVVVQPPSPYVAGLIAAADAAVGGAWAIPSNRLLSGISGTSRPVDFVMGDPNTRANQLNAQNVATIIREDGYRLWGPRTFSSDAKWQYLNVRRTADLVNQSILQSHLWAVDRGIRKNYVANVVEGVNRYLRRLKNPSRGAIVGGEAWADPEANPSDAIQNGNLTIDFEFTPVYPAERLTFRSRLTDRFIEEIF